MYLFVGNSKDESSSDNNNNNGNNNNNNNRASGVELLFWGCRVLGLRQCMFQTVLKGQPRVGPGIAEAAKPPSESDGTSAICGSKP